MYYLKIILDIKFELLLIIMRGTNGIHSKCKKKIYIYFNVIIIFRLCVKD